MANVGTAAAGKTLIGAGNGSSPTFASIGTNSGLTANGVVIAEGNGAFQASTAGTSGQVLMSNGAGVNPSFQSGGSSFATTYIADSGSAVPAAGNLNVLGGTSAAGTSPVVTSGSGNTITTNVQRSQALAAADSTKVGLSNFSSVDFAVAATGFVTLATTGAAKTITGDSGGALSPTANNWNILGLSGSKTSGSGSTLTIKSPPFSQIGSSATSSLNTGEFVTAAVTRTLPASAGLADGDLFIYVCTTASALVIQSVTAQKIRIGNQISSAAGTATSNAIGDSLSLRFNATDGFFYAVSVIGTWTLA